jgi:predicted DsbA family dithiol-disulfide isomerase
MRVEIYSDVVCPWCYIGERRFARALAAFPQAGRVEVVYRSYQLDPEAPAEAVPLKQYLARRYGALMESMLARATETAAAEGIVMDWDRALVVNTLTAHRLLGLAEREYGAEVQRALADKLFEAHFTRGVDVADHEQLAGLAGSAGMDRARVLAYLASDEGLAETREALAQARRIGVRAVPTFVFDGEYAVEGAQPASVFLQVLEGVASRNAPGGAAGGADDACADGACVV